MNFKGTKKLVSILLVFVLLFGVAACSGDTRTSSSEDGTTVKDDTKKVDDSASTSSDEVAGEVTAAEPVKFSISMTDGLLEYARQQEDIDNEKWVKAFNERFNAQMEVKLMDHKALKENYQIMFAAGDIPDVVMCFDGYTRPELSGSVEAGVFMPLNDLLEENKDQLTDLMAAIPEHAWAEVTYEGNIYGIPSVYLSNSARRATYIRKDLLDDLGLEVPETVEDFVDVLRAFKEAGVKYPYSGRSNFIYTDIFFGAYGIDISTWNLDDEGKLTPDFLKPEMEEALALLAELNSEGLMDPESLTNTGSDWINKIAVGDVGLFNHNASSFAIFQSKLTANDPEAELMLIPSPVGPEGKSGMFRYSSINQSLYINKDYGQAKEFLLMLNEIVKEENNAFFQLGIEGEDYTVENDEIKYIYPTESLDVSEASWRNFMRIARDEAYAKMSLPFAPGGEEVLSWFENIAPNEGLEWISPGKLEIFEEKPELKPDSNANAIFNEYAAKIFFGDLPASAHDDFVAEYLERGGDEVIRQATEKYNNGEVYFRK